MRACLALLLAACTATDATTDLELATGDVVPTDGKADHAWQLGATLHVGEQLAGRAAAGARAVYPVWLAGSETAPIALDIVASAHGDGDVRVAVLGPLRAGAREVIAAAGYASPRANLELTIDAVETGEHLVVVGSYALATETAFSVTTACAACTSAQTDVLAEPKLGALVATETGGRVLVQLGDVLADRTSDVEVALWASPPAQPWAARAVASAVASGAQATIAVPAAVAAGDDLRLVVREAGGRVLDSGVVTRYAPEHAPLVRTDALVYGDVASIGASGIVGYYEGIASLSLRSETRAIVIAEADVHATLPGQPGNGFGVFDARFLPPLADADGVVNPDLPRMGELLSIGYRDGDGGYRRLGCFEYCNDLSGEAACTGGTRACPTARW